MPMMKVSKECVIYIYLQHALTGISNNDFTSGPVELSNVDTQCNLKIFNECSVCLTSVESSKKAHSIVILTTRWQPGA